MLLFLNIMQSFVAVPLEEWIKTCMRSSVCKLYETKLETDG